MRLNISKALISRLTEGHKILGIALSFVLYLICMTGTLVVFYQEMERWENPNLPEYSQYQNSNVAKAIYNTRAIMIADKNREPIQEDIYLTLPSQKIPRIVASYNDDARAYNANGEYVGSAAHPNTHFISELHYYLHLPENFGMILVSIFGIFMLALLIGGALSHKKMFKDAFKLRPRDDGHLGRADVHNRIGTWSLPFAIVVTATGSFIGFSQIIVFLIATIFYQGDFGKVMDPILGSPKDSKIITQNQPLAGEVTITNALGDLKAKVPSVTPVYIVMKKAATDTPYIEIIAKDPLRLSYGDTYRFDANGNLKGKNGNLDGEIGKQIYSSLFPLHFGSYGGLPIQFAYFFVGLALCLMINAGMEIWFNKCVVRSNPRPILHSIWVSFVYSSIGAIAIAMISNFVGLKSDVLIYWLSLVSLVFLGLILFKVNNMNILILGRIMRMILAISIIGLVLTHFIKFGAVNMAALSINIPLLLISIAILIPTMRALLKLERGNLEPVRDSR